MTPALIALSVFLETSSQGDTGWLLLLGPAGAVAVYWGLYQYYRNTGQSHSFERETIIEAKPITGNDRRVDSVRGTSRSSINGNNVHSYRIRVRRL